MTDIKLINDIADALVADHVELMRENAELRAEIESLLRERDAERARRVRAEKWLNESAGGVTPSDSGSGAATPDSRERPALIGDQVDADIARLRGLSVGPWAAESQSSREMASWYAECANRYEIIAGAYFAAWQRERHALAGGE